MVEMLVFRKEVDGLLRLDLSRRGVACPMPFLNLLQSWGPSIPYPLRMGFVTKTLRGSFLGGGSMGEMVVFRKEVGACEAPGARFALLPFFAQLFKSPKKLGSETPP